MVDKHFACDVKENIENGETKDEKDTKEDTLAKAIGELGRWQMFLLAILSITSQVSAGWNLVGIIFLAPKTQYRCLSRNNTTERITFGTCYSDCDKYEYITEFDDSIITEFELICKKAWLANLAQTVFMFGALVGSMIFGYLADRYGRRTAVLIASMTHLALSLILPLCPSYWSFAITRFLLGTTTAGLMVITFVILIEITGTSKREMVASLFHVPFILGEMVMPGIAYYLRSWRSFALGIGLPNLLFLFYIFLVPESPRWLISVGKLEEASEIMKKAAKRNKLPTNNMLEVAQIMANESSKSKDQEEHSKVSYVDLITHPGLRMRNLFSCVCWFILGLTYYGGTQYIGQTSPNVFVAISLAGGLQVVSMLVSGIMIKHFGRRYVILGFLILNAICSGLLAMPDEWYYLKIIVSAVSISCSAGAFNSMYIFTAELFPTTARNMAVGASFTMSRVGSMMAPFVAGMSLETWIPPLIFAVAPFIAAWVCWYLPETKGKTLMDKLVDEYLIEFVMSIYNYKKKINRDFSILFRYF